MLLEDWIKEQIGKKEVIIAIDGMCASGKTSLANQLHDLLGGNIFHMDDFFLPLQMRTDARLNTPGGNVHYERFLDTVLKPLKNHQDVYYQAFDCKSMSYKESVCIPYHPINIIEGSYALHPLLKEYYDDYIVLYIDENIQKKRLYNRNPKMYDIFIERWIPLENKYFEYYKLFELEHVVRMD